MLITGDSGTGKEIVSTVIHQLSPRRHHPFVKVNCAAIAANLIEAELFGWERGAFTDAKERRLGLFEQAEGGTLFLDEIGELSLDLQVKLLRALQQRTIRRLGGTQEIKIDVRIIAATNRNLAVAVREGRFRIDLFYRLNVYPIHLEPLRLRPEDIRPLSTLFLSQIAKKYGIDPVPRLSESAIKQAKEWEWPGNVRELRNVLTRAVLTSEPVIRSLPLMSDLVNQIDDTFGSGTGFNTALSPLSQSRLLPTSLNPAGAESIPMRDERPSGLFNEPLPDFETLQKAYFRSILKETRGKISGANGAAERTGLHPNTLRSRLLKLGIVSP